MPHSHILLLYYCFKVLSIIQCWEFGYFEFLYTLSCLKECATRDDSFQGFFSGIQFFLSIHQNKNHLLFASKSQIWQKMKGWGMVSVFLWRVSVFLSRSVTFIPDTEGSRKSTNLLSTKVRRIQQYLHYTNTNIHWSNSALPVSMPITAYT